MFSWRFFLLASYAKTLHVTVRMKAEKKHFSVVTSTAWEVIYTFFESVYEILWSVLTFK